MYPPMTPNGPETAGVYFRDSRVYREMIAMLKQDLVPLEDQMGLLEAMTPTAQRNLVSRISTLDASILLTFKKQIQLVDTVLRRLVNEDGTKMPNADDMGINIKDAMAMSLKVTQVMTRDLPKLYTLERIQRQEEALRRVMEKHLSPELQDALLLELEQLESGT